MKNCWYALILVFLSLVAGSNSLTAAIDSSFSTKQPPNIVFFLVDDLGWSDIGCYGSSFYDTPNVDKLATQGVRFTSAYAACHVCSPTRASLLTGKYPARLGLTDWISGRRDFDFQTLNQANEIHHLPQKEITIAETLKANGYRTAIFGKWHLGNEPNGPTSQGFDLQVPNWNGCCPKGGYYGPFAMKGIAGKKGDYLTDRLTDEALKFIAAKKDKPFFLYMSHFAVHDPIHGRPDLVKKYQDKLAKLDRKADSVNKTRFILEGNPDDAEPLTRKQLNALMAQPSHQGHRVLPQRTVKIKQQQDNVRFAAMVEAMDQSLGRIMKKLETLGLTDNTIVIFYSDNGGMSAGNWGNPKRVVPNNKLDTAYATSNLPLRGAKGWLYEGGIRVPLIVKWPKQGKQNVLNDEPINSPDFYPTLLEMAGIDALPKQHVDGASFVDAVKGKPFDRGPIFWHFPHYSNHGMQSPGGAVRDGDYKLLEYFENGKVQLFNLKEDIGEKHNLAAAQPKKVRELLAKLYKWRQATGAEMPTKK
jgi:arylsulfatase A